MTDLLVMWGLTEFRALALEKYEMSRLLTDTHTVEISAVFCLSRIRNKRKEYETEKEDYERFISK